jgi:hypothetical protein
LDRRGGRMTFGVMELLVLVLVILAIIWLVRHI